MVSRQQTADHFRRTNRKQAGRYDRAMRITSRFFDIDGGRRWACGGARGDALEIGVGTGPNLPLYPPDVALTVVDLTPEMLERTRARAADIGRRVHLHEGDATRLPFADASFDTVVSTLTLCTIPGPELAVREAWRVCRPGGELRFFEWPSSPTATAPQWVTAGRKTPAPPTSTRPSPSARWGVGGSS
jgi:ubiquinone/menaquinone biosynthesis C-methylase UbiE